MSGFKKLKQTDKLRLKQRGGVVVFLESGEDFEIVHKRWFFDEGQDIWFQPADGYEPGTGGGGCKAVIALVAEARAYGINAFGLVDRDVLLSDQNWPLWWQEQDDLFLSERPYGYPHSRFSALGIGELPARSGRYEDRGERFGVDIESHRRIRIDLLF
jgi:hypothetical protein